MAVERIVIHHSFTPKNQDLKKTVASISRNHQARLKQPKSRRGYHTAYHWIIGGKGDAIQTRDYDEVGYHASNWQVNKSSVGICLVGNFDAEEPNKEQLFKLRDIIKDIKSKLYIKEVNGHRKYSNKTCPGKHLTDSMIETAFKPTK